MKQEERSLETLVDELTVKQTHVRNAFDAFLKRWGGATCGIDNKNLAIIDLCAAGPDVMDGRYALRTGIRKLQTVDAEEWLYAMETRNIDTRDVDMAKLRQCIRKLPTALKEYAEKVEKTTQDCDALLALIPNQED
ncbi:MAG TPA: hypothetical protein VMW50_07825 [Dehalococcoidia bacterium]|nr:hypothetical protein [Dehalococcoidia bacterium]